VIRSRTIPILVVGLLAAGVRAGAEPIFLSRQYSRCTSCHYSATGGGLLTPYGRSLSREELSTFGRSRGPSPGGREHEFLFGLLGGAAGPVSLGIDLRPSHLGFESGGESASRNFLMNAELTAAARHRGLTFYAELGRQPRGDPARIASFEHWVSYRTQGGLGLRAGRFLPAYGIHLADHTALTRAPLGLDSDDQVYAVEVSFAGQGEQLQLSLGPGFADAGDGPSRRAFTATGRLQLDVRPNVVVVASGLFRGVSDLDPRHGATGLALGFAPSSRLTLWAEADVRFRKGAGGGSAGVLLAEAALEVHRGVWIRLSPQLATELGGAPRVFRLDVGLDLFPRTHWNLVVGYYHDRREEVTTRTLLLQLHLYL